MSRLARLSKPATLDEYFEWLCDLVDGRGYRRLMGALHDKPFFWSVPNDDNRAFEGKNLREKFCEEASIEYVYHYFDEDCSMLELLIGMSYRCESIMADQNGDIEMKEWFWKMLSNVGLDMSIDARFDGVFVEEKLNMIVERRYRRDGKGGLFPLKRAAEDQRKVELWYQMSNYLVENYYTEDMFV